MFDNAIVLELGAGVGLASIVASMFADKVFATGSLLFSAKMKAIQQVPRPAHCFRACTAYIQVFVNKCIKRILNIQYTGQTE